MIEVEGLRKQFGQLVAVDGISFRAEPGRIFGLLGPNGAGKTTAISCISGLLSPDEGNVRILGYDVVSQGIESRRQLGVVPQELALYEDLSARENLSYWGAAYGLGGSVLRTRVESVLERIGLADRAGDLVKKFSGGMKRRLNFGCAVVHQPKALLLDEPTVGVDPQSRVRLLDMVKEEANQGTCVLYTTHYMEEAENLCSSLVILDRGRIIASGTLEELRALLGERDILRLSGLFEPEATRLALRDHEDIDVVQIDPESMTLSIPHATRRLSELFPLLAAAGAEVRETTLTQPNLESLFIKLTGKELRE
jgi:ABC-2 type transport system ATP-binding protein